MIKLQQLLARVVYLENFEKCQPEVYKYFDFYTFTQLTLQNWKNLFFQPRKVLKDDTICYIVQVLASG
jgi:hypothetical protein